VVDAAAAARAQLTTRRRDASEADIPSDSPQVDTAMFFRLHADGAVQPADLRDQFAGPTRTPCWLIGGGPSLADLPTASIAASPIPKFAVNLAGHGLLRPTFWTSYDPTIRFHRSIYLDPSIIKFVHRCRAMDLVPGTTFKVCEAPSTLFFHRAPQLGYRDFLAPRAEAIVDWQDSLVQAIDLAYRLGFRTLYLAGCDMCVRPSAQQLEVARSVGVDHRPGEPLKEFLDRCRRAGLTAGELDPLETGRQYHFDEAKPLAAAVQTDLHYFRVAQYLRLARRAIALAGLEIISVTPHSRLNDHFPYRSAADVLREIAQQIGDPRSETTRGQYTSTAGGPAPDLAPMRDLPPHNWPRKQQPAASPRQARDIVGPRPDRDDGGELPGGAPIDGVQNAVPPNDDTRASAARRRERLRAALAVAETPVELTPEPR